MFDFPTVSVPAFEFHFNLVVYPLPATSRKTGCSYFYILKDNAVKPKLTGGTHWLEFLPDHVYCFLPSMRGDVGLVKVYDHMPDFVKDFLLCMEIQGVAGSASKFHKVVSKIPNVNKADGFRKEVTSGVPEDKTFSTNKNSKRLALQPGKAEHFFNFGKYSKRLKRNEKEIKPNKLINRKCSNREHMKVPCSEINEPCLDKENVISLRILKGSFKQKQLVVNKPSNIFTILKDYEPKIGEIENVIENRQSKTDDQKKMDKGKRKRKENPKCKSKNVQKNVPNHKSKMLQGDLNVMRFQNCQNKHLSYKKFCRWCIAKRKTHMNYGNQDVKQKVTNCSLNKIKEYKNQILDRINYLENNLYENLLRLSGGAAAEEQSSMVSIAIENAKKHGIDLTPGVINKADGNCAFDAVINNINQRSCFPEKLNLSSSTYRQIWVTELESESNNFPSLGAGYTEDERKENWNRLKESGVYEIDFFGDFVIHAISRGCHKNILIFNTSLEASFPVYLIEAKEFGGFTDSEIPVLLGYNQVHYESLHPCSVKDIEKTKELEEAIRSGNYPYQKKDMNFFTGRLQVQTPIVDPDDMSKRKENRKGLDIVFQSILPLHLKDKKPRQMNENEKKEYTNLRRKFLKGNEVEEKANQRKASQRQSMARMKRNEPEEKANERRASQRQLKARMKLNEPEEKANKRRASQRQLKSRMKLNEPEEKANKRKASQRQSMARMKRNEAEEKANTRKASQRQAMTRTRENRTEEEKELEQQNQRIIKAAKNAIITSDEKIDAQVVRQKQNPKFLKARQDLKIEENRTPDYLGNIFDQPECNFCQAQRWPSESKTNCCSGGKLLKSVSSYIKPPAALCKLLQDKEFCKNIKEYNNALAFASLGIDQAPEIGPNFKILGKLHHKIGSLGHPTEEKPKFAQLYFYDQENEIQNRLDHQTKNLKPKIIKILQKMLHEKNPYVSSLKSALDVCSENANLRLVLHADAKLKPKEAHTRQFNLPLGSEVAVLLPGEQSGDLDVILHTKGNKLQHINSVHRSYDPLHYVLLLPFGQDGFQPGLKLGESGHVSVSQFYAFHIQVRKDDFNIVLRCHKLSQQYMADMYAKVERGRLNWVYLNQKTIKVEKYKGLIDAQNNGDINDAGKTIVLPPTITGSPRWYVERYQDAMAIVRNAGKPDLFITMTCNSNWPEIQESLLPGECAFDRPDICARVFKLKSDMMVKDIVEDGIFGRTVAHVFTIEWQKRKGLPHMHLLVTLHPDFKIRDPKEIDAFISAELPNPEVFPALHKAVMKHMIHGPCGKLFQRSPCMEFIGNTKTKKCSKDFPKEFQAETEISEFSYPLYKRRSPEDGGRTATIERYGHKITIDNQLVVPYCPFLLEKYDCHFNVELVCSVVSVKYMYKYISKGPDRIIVKITEENKEIEKDEVAKFLNCRYLSASESAWKLLGQAIHGRSHAVMKLNCHLPHEQSVLFEKGDALNALQSGEPDTHLTAWFKINEIDEGARTVLYPDFPQKYTWIQAERKWKIRKRKFNTFGRVPSVPFNIKTLEIFSMRLLLHHVPGAVDFTSLRTLNGVVFPTFQAACIERGLLDDETELDKVMDEAFLIQFGEQLRSLFCSILLYSTPSKPLEFWIRNREKLAEDWTKEHGKEKAINMVLMWLEKRLALAEVKLKSLGLPEPDESLERNKGQTIISEELNFDKDKQRSLADKALNLMNKEQEIFFNVVIDATNGNAGGLFFLDAPGGTGKTFVLNALLSSVRSGGFIALATAISAVASKLLANGSTVHSKLKVPIQIKDNSFCSFSKNDATGKLLMQTKLIIIDEVSMGHKHVYEAIDRTLRELTNIDKPFGNIIVVFAGDWRQCLPIIPNGSEGQIVDACLKFSFLWKYVKVFNLKENMRIRLSDSKEAKKFSDFLLSIGDGTIGDLINMPVSLMTKNDKTQELIDFVFPNIERNYENRKWLSERAILCPTNAEADEINERVSKMLPVEEKIYKSCDNTDDYSLEFPSEFLNTINLPGMPPHKLILKKGMPVMLLRNLDPKNGHCNGVKYVVTFMADHVIEVISISGTNTGKKLFIPRISLISSSATLPFSMRRKQFPIKPAFAMTANKSQGQTLGRVGIYLGTDFFSHGQLYVAMSRCGDPNSIKILKRKEKNCEEKSVRNVVYRAVLN